MGRALLIITLGSFIILGIIQQAVNNRQITMTEGNIESFMVSHGRNQTGSALEMAVNRVMHDADWEDEPRPWSYPLEGMNVDVWVDTNDDFPNIVDQGFLRVRAVLNLDNRQITSSAFLQQGILEMPQIDAALAAYDDESTATIRGNSDSRISGIDTNPGELEGSGPEETLTGIIGTIDATDFVDQMGGGSDLAYVGEPPYEKKDLDGTELNELAEMYKEMGTIVSNENEIGSRENPRISIIDGDQHWNGANGAGILLITEGSELLITGGNFTYEGLVIVMGDFENRANTTIYGGILMTDNALLDLTGSDAPGVEFRGTTHVYYSSQALENVQNRLGGGGSGAIVNRILY